MPDYLLFVATEVPRSVINPKTKIWEQLYFSVPVEQFERQIPSLYVKLKAENRQVARCAVTHADADGNIRMENLIAVRQYKPDVLFTCYAGESRRMNPDLAIYGNYQVRLMTYQPEIGGAATRLIRFSLSS